MISVHQKHLPLSITAVPITGGNASTLDAQYQRFCLSCLSWSLDQTPVARSRAFEREGLFV